MAGPKKAAAPHASRGNLTDRSGTVTAGGTSQQLAAANASRAYLLVQNQSAGDLYLNFGVAAVGGQPSVRVAAGASFLMDGTFVSGQAVHVYGATTGQAFAAKEG